MAIKSFKSIVNSMTQYLRSKRPNVDTKPGTFVRDVVIDPVASELESFYIDLEAISNAQSPDLAAVTDIETLGQNFQLQRKLPSKATGNVIFYSFSSPSSTITIDQGTLLSSKAFADGSAQQFTTTQTVTLGPTNFNANTGRFEVSAPVRAVLAGTTANVPAGAVSAIVSSIAGVSGVYNPSAFISGTDFEPLASFRARIKKVMTGNNIGTQDGYYNSVIVYPNVSDVKIATPTSTLGPFIRTNIGTVDIYVRGLVSSQVLGETYVVTTAAAKEFSPIKQPLDLLAKASFTLVGSITGTLSEYHSVSNPTGHYSFVQDTSKVAGSVQARDKFVFINGAVTVGETITATYSYNSLIPAVQAYMEDPLRKVLGADMLIKAALPRQIDVACTISIASGFASSEVVSSVGTAISNKLNTYKIAETVQQSDILTVIAETSGVDDVAVPLTTFAENSATGSLIKDSNGNIVIPANSYAVPGTITVTTRI